MRYFHHLPYFLSIVHHANTLTFSEPSSLLSNATQTSLSNLTPSSLLPPLDLHCDTPHTSPSLDIDDCFNVLERLPSQSQHALFHNGNGRTFYKLPLSISIAHCGVRIELIDHVTQEESSWDAIYDGASSLVTECVDSQEGRGGYVLVGDHLLIQVTILYIDAVAERSHNGTILSSRTPSSSTLSASAPHCYPRHGGHAPEFRDCVIAVHLMSRNRGPGVFHRGGANDGYHLPKVYHYQTCYILVGLVHEAQEEISNWLSVGLDTELVIKSCVKEGAHLGGSIFVGNQRRIRVLVGFWGL